MPFVDLAWQHEVIADNVLEPLIAVMAKGSFINGPDVAAFESEFAAFSGASHCVGVANGTDAIELALRAARIEAGTSVIVPANTFIATAEAVVRAGARPQLVDCDRFGLIDPAGVAATVGPETSAVIPVHLFGQMADMEAISQVADTRHVKVVEDAAQAQGASRSGRGIGSFGIAAATSFYPGKNLGAYGDGGAVLTNDMDVARSVRRLANHGSDVKYEHSEVGWNSRLDTIQAVVLRAKLRRLSEWNDHRRWAAGLYDEMLQPLADRGLLRRPEVAPGNSPVWHLYVIRVDRRDEILADLAAARVGSGIHYPVPVHLAEAFRYLGHGPGDFPVAEAMAAEILSLPIYPGITEGLIARVVQVLTLALKRR